MEHKCKLLGAWGHIFATIIQYLNQPSMKNPGCYQPNFIPKLDAAIERNIADSSLSVKMLLRMVGMSRTDLHRKLHNFYGVSTTEYLRSKRLQRALLLLEKEPNMSIFQVAEEVGFNNQGYFIRRFRERFGCCPSQCKKNKN